MENTNALALPDEAQFGQDIQAINRFQQIVHKNLIAGSDFGIIPGTQKPTLLKPGAEKIAKLLNLADQYEILDKKEDWSAGFFHYIVKCRLIHTMSGTAISEGVGECNSKESKYRFRWVFPSELPQYQQGDEGKPERDKLASKLINTRNGKARVYRVDNEDIYDQTNTILKMARKRALVDAALSAGRLSNVFTQDIEDASSLVREEPEVKQNSKPQPDNPIVAEAEKLGARPVEALNTEPRDPFKNAGELLMYCWKQYKLKREQTLGILNVESPTDIHNLEEAAERVKKFVSMTP